jgi:signal transduction histidine kinase/CheY-like chemotaxis protein
MPASLERYEKELDVWLDVRAYPIVDEDGNIVKVIEHLRDITATKRVEIENRRLNKKLQQVQKMESLGTLAGGIAHDFNNLLMGIQGRISLMSMDMEPNHRNREHTKAIDTYIQSATNLTKQLLGLAREGKYEVLPIDINALVLESSALFGRTRKEIEIRTDKVQGGMTVEVDKRQIEQALLNIYINAWQAMPEGGTLDIAAKTVRLKEKESKAYKVRPGNYVQVSISDTGIGMNKDTIEKIFDPFFTTKEKKRGTGLGLASAYGIVKNHGGLISAKSEIGVGSTFSILLPLSVKAAHVEPPRQSGVAKGMETVLLVDDENIILDVGKAMLEKLGYRVFLAKGGEEAVVYLRKAEMSIDLVILDMIMPGLDGGSTFDLIRECQPKIPVILSSGYTLNDQARKIMQKGCNGFIQKPFNLSELSDKIRSVLDPLLK